MTTSPSQIPSTQFLRQAIETDLKRANFYLNDNHAESIGKILSYHLGWMEESKKNVGKRIRPLLTLLSCAAVGGDWKHALPLASSIELIHNFSLIHDDIEDSSQTRRGIDTVWVRWGIPKAINIGDAVFILARLSAHRMQEYGVPAETILRVFEALDRACLRLTIGQDLDLAFESRDDVTEEEYLYMIEGKTSALLAAATSCGAIVAQAPSDWIDTLASFGHHLGLAFQIRDDILGIWGESAKTGKSTGDDLRARKKTLPVIYGLRHSTEFRDLWNSQRSDDSALDSMRTALDSSGGHSYAGSQAEKHTEIALHVLQSISVQNQALLQMSEIATNLVNRQK